MIDGTSVTLELTELLKTRTTQNDQNYLRIYIFDKKKYFLNLTECYPIYNYLRIEARYLMSFSQG